MARKPLATVTETIASPDTLFEFLTFIIKQFGGIAIATGFAMWVWNDANEQAKKVNERLVSALESRAKTDAELANALTNLSHMIEQIARDAATAHKVTASK